MPRNEAEQFVVTLRAEPGDDRPAVIRLRAFLKLARRMFKLQCVTLASSGGTMIAQDSGPEPDAAQPTSETGQIPRVFLSERV